MGALLQYDIAVVGVKNVDRALSSIETRFAQHNARVGRMLGTSRPRSGGGQSTSRQADREAKALAREQQRQSDYWHKAKLAQQRQLHAAEERERRKKGREEERDLKKRKRLVEQQLKEERAARTQFVRSTVGNSAGRIGGAAKAVGGAGLALTGIAGAGLAASAVSQASRVDEQVRRVLIGGRDAGGKLAFSPDDVRKRVMRTSTATGIAAEDVASGMATYVSKTGDVKGAVNNAETFGTVAQATGAHINDVAAAAAALRNNLGITDINEMADALAKLTFSGKKGSFELKNMAGLLERITAGLKSRGLVSSKDDVGEIGSILQVVQSSTGNAEVTSSGVDAMFRQMVANAGKLQSGAFGSKVNVFKDGDKKKGLRSDMGGLIADTIGATKGDAIQLNKLFGDEGSKAANPFISKFREASNGGKDVAAGKAAIKAMIADFNVDASFKDVQDDANEAMKSFSVQMEIFNTHLKEAVASQLFPELVKLAPELKQLLPHVKDATKAFVGLVKFFANNPFVGIGGIIATSIAYDIAKAKLGDVVASALKGAFGGGGGDVSVGGGGGGWANKPIRKGGKTTIGGALGAAGTGLAVGGMLASMIVHTGVANFENAEVNIKEAGKDLNSARGMGLEDIEKLRKLKQEQFSRVMEARGPSFADSFGLGDFLDPSRAGEIKTQEAFLDEISDRLNKLEVLNDIAQQLAKAGVSQEEAAKKLEEAAKRMGLNLPNRGPSPSPVKP